jgi:hypothetical protein
MSHFMATYFGVEPTIAQLIWMALSTVAIWLIRWVWGGGFKHPVAYWFIAPPAILVLLSAFGYASRGGEPLGPDFRIVPVKITLAKNPLVPNGVAVLLGLDVFNNGRDSVATDWELTATVPGEFSDKVSQQITIPPQLKVSDASTAEVYNSANALVDKTLEPIRRGGVVPGIIFFLFNDTDADSLMRSNSTFTLSWKDSEGTLYHYDFAWSDFSNKTNAPSTYAQQPGVPETQISGTAAACATANATNAPQIK